MNEPYAAAIFFQRSKMEVVPAEIAEDDSDVVVVAANWLRPMLSLLLWRKRSNLSLPGGDGDAVQNQVARRGAQVEGEKSGATAGTVAYAPHS